jgi:hypothetical protein
VTPLVLHAYAQRLAGVMEANFLPADPEAGLWNPAFAALGMPTIARQWGELPLAFPFARRTARSTVGWPLVMVVEGANLAAWHRELATPWKARLAALPITALDPEATEPGDYFTRAELALGITQLARWVAKARAPTKARVATARTRNALVLVLDGDQ